MALYGIIWQYMAVYGMWHSMEFMRYMTACGIKWHYMALYGILWHYMALYGM
jgi:hypothetical protein